MIKKFKPFATLVLFAFLTIGVYACGSSPGGTAVSSGDTTAPVTSPTGTDSGSVTVVTFSCSDASGCDKTFISTGSYSWVNYDDYIEAGKTVEISGGDTVMYFSIDKANNAEAVKSITY